LRSTFKEKRGFSKALFQLVRGKEEQSILSRKERERE
jgi:hypothetical protein